jgi:hypothetical protein
MQNVPIVDQPRWPALDSIATPARMNFKMVWRSTGELVKYEDPAKHFRFTGTRASCQVEAQVEVPLSVFPESPIRQPPQNPTSPSSETKSTAVTATLGVGHLTRNRDMITGELNVSIDDGYQIAHSKTSHSGCVSSSVKQSAVLIRGDRVSTYSCSSCRHVNRHRNGPWPSPSIPAVNLPCRDHSQSGRRRHLRPFRRERTGCCPIAWIRREQRFLGLWPRIS